MSFKYKMGIFMPVFVFLFCRIAVMAESLPRIPDTSVGIINSTLTGNKSEPFRAVKAITLSEAVSRTIKYNQELAAAAWEAGVQEAGIRQSGMRPNPEIELGVEEFGGSAARKKFESAEMSLRLSQVIEIGGKRAKRKQIASLDHTLAQWDFEIKRMDILTGVIKSFIELLGAQEKLILIRKSEKLAEQFYDMVGEKVRAGQVPPLEESRAKVALATERLKRQQAEYNLQTIRKETSAFWGESNPAFEFASGNLESILPAPHKDNPEELILKNPELTRWVVEMERRSAILDMEKKNRVPDISVSGGISRFKADRETAFLMGLSVPFPIFDRNKGNIIKAERQLFKGRAEQYIESINIKNNIFARYQALSFAYEQASNLANEVIPAAQNALSIAEEGYSAGKFSYIDVLDAQRTLFEIQEQNIDALTVYHSAIAEIERLTGAPFEDIIPESR